MGKDFICPICWQTYAEPTWPTCPDCESEAVEIDVVPLNEFIRSKTVAELKQAIRSWQNAKEFRETFRQQVVKRIRAVLNIKRRKK